MLTEIITSIVTEIVMTIGNWLWVPVKNQIGYLRHFNSNVDDLRDQVEKLGTLREDVGRLKELAHDRGEVIKGVVEKWIIEVDSILEEAKRLDVEANRKKRRFSEWFPGSNSSYSLGKKAKTMLSDVNELRREGVFSAVSDPAPHPSIESMLTGDFVPFASTKLAMKQVMDALKDEQFSIVGVYGQGGVGKTTLMEQVGKQMKKENFYKEVVKVTVSQNLNLERIQDEIAEKLGLTINENSVDTRSARLCARLKQEERVLLILDDLWEELELFEVGIPHGDEHKGCKIVLTSRNRDVCNRMLCQVTINVKVLSYSDSWVLFKRKTGAFIESPSFKTVATNVVKECGGLPIAIVTLARALRGKDESYWNDSLVQLKSSIGMDEKLFKSLVISFKALEDEEMKLCFLFCCLFPEDSDISIETLMQYGFGEGLYKDVLTLEEARGRVRTSIDKLKAACLLLEGNIEGNVKMHDVIRDLAIKISSKDEYKSLAKARLGLERWPEREQVDKCYRISLVQNKIRVLPDRPECPKLMTLLLSGNYSLHNIPSNFYEEMKTLVVLDLSHTNISPLPSSFSCLINLRTLFLNKCFWLNDLSILGGLKKLEILRLQSSRIRVLPKEIGQLTNLKLLDLTDSNNLEMVAPNVISRLTLLEELYMTHSFSKWEIQGKEHGGKASFVEVTSLPYLTVLNVHVENIEILSQDIYGPWKNLREFCFCVGGKYKNPPGKRCMYVYPGRIVDFGNWVKVLVEKTEFLFLLGGNRFENVEPLFNRDLNNLKTLEIRSFRETINIIRVGEVSRNAFGSLETLQIFDMAMLRNLCDGPVQSGFFANLRVLILEGCNKLVTLLPTGLLQAMQNLENIDVSSCDELRELFDSTEHGEEDGATLTKLTWLTLKGLENLTTIWKGHIPVGSLQSLKKLEVANCHSLRYLLLHTLAQTVQQLEHLEMCDCDKIEGLISREAEDSAVMEQIACGLKSDTRNSPKLLPPLLAFQNLRKLCIERCHTFKYIFSWKLAYGLSRLEELELYYCDGMEVIIAEEEDEVGMADSCVLPQLKTLSMYGLGKLVSFFQGESSLDMASLETLKVAYCGNLKRLPLGPQSAPNLKKILAEKEWFEELEWGVESITKARLQPLFEEAYSYIVMGEVL